MSFSKSISFILCFFFLGVSYAQDGFQSNVKEERKRDDVAFVLLNEQDGKVIEGMSSFYMNNILKTHYKNENIIILSYEELRNCSSILSQSNSYSCKLLTENPEQCDFDKTNILSPENSDMVENTAKSLAEYLQGCPRLKEIKDILEKAKNIDAYAAIHGKRDEAKQLSDFLSVFGKRPDIQNKLRLFYSMGCYEGNSEESTTPKIVLKSGFSTFLGHEGVSFSPLVYNQIMTQLKMGHEIQQVEKKINKNIGNSFLGKGSSLIYSGDPYLTISGAPSIEQSLVKKCNALIGKENLEKLLNEKCLTVPLVVTYLNKFPHLIDNKFCLDSSKKINNLLNNRIASFSIAACASVGLKMKDIVFYKMDLETIPMDSLSILNELDSELNCIEPQVLAKAIYCTSSELSEKLISLEANHKPIVSDSKEPLFMPQVRISYVQKNKFLEELKRMSPSSCHSGR